MNDLNSQQIVLLTLLVSFVTSIATGIVTVSLLEQAPEPVTQTINRIVEKTVERVVSEPVEGNDKPTEKEVVTVVVKEEDLTIDAVKRNSDSVVRVYSVVGGVKQFISLGLVIGGNGDFITDSSRIQKRNKYVAVYKNGEFPIEISYQEDGGSFVIMTPTQKDATGFVTGTYADSNSMQLGQSVIALAGENSLAVATGIITQILKEGESVTRIDTSIPSVSVLPGTMFLNLKGEIAGLNVSTVGSISFVPANMVKEFLSRRVPVVANK